MAAQQASAAAHLLGVGVEQALGAQQTLLKVVQEAEYAAGYQVSGVQVFVLPSAALPLLSQQWAAACLGFRV